MSAPHARIGIDVSTVVAGMTGVGQYTRNIARAVASLDNSHEYVFLSNRQPHVDICGSAATSVSRSRTRLGWLQFTLPKMLRREPVDLVHYTNYMAGVARTAPYVLTIYDMTLRLFRSRHQLKRSLLLGSLQPMMARRAALIITLSESSKADIVRLLGIPPERIRVVPGAAGAQFTPGVPAADIDRVRAAYQLPERFALHVGTIEPRKNVPLLVEAFAAARRSANLPHALVLAGARGWKTAAAEAAIRTHGDGFVRQLGYVPDEDLPALYRAAELFICPTAYEGFGLPNLEALACGTPVITTRVSSIPEVVGDAAILVVPGEVKQLADAICAIANDAGARARLAAAGPLQAARFSWAASARKTLDVYEEALGCGDSTATRVNRAASPHEEFSQAEWRFALARLAYHDLFDYPLTIRQLMADLNGHVPVPRLHALLAAHPLLMKRTERHGEYLTLTGRGRIVLDREARERRSRDLIRRNRDELGRIAAMPFVRMVAISGSLTYGNNRATDDIDLFIVADRARVWLTFLLLVLRHKLLGKRATFCPNFIIGDGDLEIREKDFYNAQQILGLQPLSGQPLFGRFLAANSWVDRYRLAAPPTFPVVPTSDRPRPTLTERLLAGRIGDAFEWIARALGMRRMLGKRSPSGMAVSLDREYIKLHFVDHRDEILAKFRDHLRTIGLEPADSEFPGEASRS